MSIYLVQLLQAFLPFVCITALLLPSLQWRKAALWGVAGVVLGYMAFFIFRANADDFYYGVNCALAVSLLLMLGISFVRLKSLHEILFCVLAFLFMARYCYMSRLYPLFSTDFLETLAISSMGLIALGVVLCCAAFALLRMFAARWLGILVVLVMLNALAGDILLKLMQDSIIETHSLLLSYVAKTIHYGFLIPYLLVGILGILGIILLFKLPPKPRKQHFLDTTYRAQKALRASLLCRASSSVALMVFVWASLLYFDLIASRPIVIDAPTIVEPEHGHFVFDVKMLDDNKLHRYAYITNEGKVVRFFLLNRFTDRSSPGVVFDACALCGDMGYVKRGDELICIACNVRIFLPSVGKMGGCNPIPLTHRIEEDKIIISVYDVLEGSNFFSQTQQKSVTDPVSGEALINFDAPFQYSFRGITYYFANEQNQKQFIESPEQYVDDGVQIPYKIQRLAQ